MVEMAKEENFSRWDQYVIALFGGLMGIVPAFINRAKTIVSGVELSFIDLAYIIVLLIVMSGSVFLATRHTQSNAYACFFEAAGLPSVILAVVGLSV